MIKVLIKKFIDRAKTIINNSFRLVISLLPTITTAFYHYHLPHRRHTNPSSKYENYFIFTFIIDDCVLKLKMLSKWNPRSLPNLQSVTVTAVVVYQKYVFFIWITINLGWQKANKAAYNASMSFITIIGMMCVFFFSRI